MTMISLTGSVCAWMLRTVSAIEFASLKAGTRTVRLHGSGRGGAESVSADGRARARGDRLAGSSSLAVKSPLAEIETGWVIAVAIFIGQRRERHMPTASTSFVLLGARLLLGRVCEDGFGGQSRKMTHQNPASRFAAGSRLSAISSSRAHFLRRLAQVDARFCDGRTTPPKERKIALLFESAVF
jgi:hypothetical protein